ncbi:MAG: hypothetical protein DRZ90_09380 [Spirochaetes bacterium]|nr:MAG: hypothetical protein DRZ90_09380 [Spirochaetota bacterium]
MDNSDIADLVDEIDILIPAIMKKMEFSTLAEIFGINIDLTISQFHVLMSVIYNEGCPISTLSKSMSLSPGTMTGLVERLERKDLLIRKHDQSDRRVVTVWLTKKGVEFVSTFQKKRMEFLKIILVEMGKENRDMFISLLRTTDEIMNNLLQE